MAIDYQHIPSPAYVLDVSRLRQNLSLIAGVQERTGVKVILALKGFALWRVFPMVAEYLHGATASSLHEARLIAEEMGVQAHTYSPAYVPEEFGEIQRYSSHITFNSISQYDRFRDQLLPGISPGLRVNPEYSDVATDLYNPASPTSRLGLTAEHLAMGLPSGLEGLHIHTLCESSAAATEQLIASVEDKFGPLLPGLKWINLGGGHLMTRPGYDVDRLVAALQRFVAAHPHLEV